MTGVQWLAFVVTPALVLGTGLVVYALTGWLDRRQGQTPAE